MHTADDRDAEVGHRLAQRHPEDLLGPGEHETDDPHVAAHARRVLRLAQRRVGGPAEVRGAAGRDEAAHDDQPAGRDDRGHRPGDER